MTRYVMVPVPEEHEEAFTRELLAISMRAAVKEWDEAGVRELLAVLAPGDVAAVQAMAAATRPAERLHAAAVAAAAGGTPDDVPALVERVNAACLTQSRGFIVLTAPSVRPGAEGEHAYFLPDAAARIVRSLR